MTTDPFTRFWDKYIEKTKSYGINDKACRWYVSRCEDYIMAYKDIRLVNDNGQRVAEYLEDLGRKMFIQDWQHLQVIDALGLLFVDIVKSKSVLLKGGCPLSSDLFINSSCFNR